MGLDLLDWSWMSSSKRKPQKNEPLVSMVLSSFGIGEFKLFLLRCLFRSLSSCPILSLPKLAFYTLWV